jgi:hypothetical protein
MRVMQRSATPWIVGAALAVLVLLAVYVGGYFVLSYPWASDERYFSSAWQHQIYVPAIRVEEWIRDEDIGDGWYEPVP